MADMEILFSTANCVRVMGTGSALQLKKAIPESFFLQSVTCAVKAAARTMKSEILWVDGRVKI
jgi:hypothetical protein